MPECYIIAGSNGAGKTTFALHFFDNSSDEPRLVFHDDLGKVTVMEQALYDRLLALGEQP